MSDEEELKLLLARAEMLVTEAKEILREAQIKQVDERLAALNEALDRVRKSRRMLQVVGIVMLVAAVICLFNVVRLLW